MICEQCNTTNALNLTHAEWQGHTPICSKCRQYNNYKFEERGELTNRSSMIHLLIQAVTDET